MTHRSISAEAPSHQQGVCFLSHAWVVVFLLICKSSAECGAAGEGTSTDAMKLPQITVLSRDKACPKPQAIAIDPVNSVLYAACNGESSGIISIDAQGVIATVATTAQCPSPLSLAVTRGALYAACLNGKLVSASRDGGVRVLATPSQCSSPLRVIATDFGVFATCRDNGWTIRSSLTGDNIQVIANSSQCTAPNHLVTSTTKRFDPFLPIDIYVSCGTGANSIVRINVNNYNVVSPPVVTPLLTSSQCPQSRVLALHYPTNTLYATCWRTTTNSVDVISINTRTGAITNIYIPNTCTTTNIPESISINPVTLMVSIACGGGSGSTSIGSVMNMDVMNGGVLTTLVSSDECSNPVDVISDGNTNVVYAACFDSSHIIRINNNAYTVKTLVSLDECRPSYGVATHSNTGMVYATCYCGEAHCSDSRVISINPVNGIITTIADSTQCTRPLDVMVDNIRNMVYVACTNGVISIDIATGAVKSLIRPSVCNIPETLYFNNHNNVLYVSCSSGSIIMKNIVSGSMKIVSITQECSWPQGIAVDERTGNIYAVCWNSPSSVVVINPNNGVITSLANRAQCQDSRGITFNSMTGRVVVACYTNSIGNDASLLSINVTDSHVDVTTLTTWWECPTPERVSVNSATGVVYAGCSGNAYLRIDPHGTKTVLTTPPQCPSPYYATAASADPNHELLYATCNSNNKAVVQISTN